MLPKVSLIIFLGILLPACGVEVNSNEVVFSCIRCKGCVERQLRFIDQHALDDSLDLFLDTTCITRQKIPAGLRYEHQSHTNLFKEYGAFGNVLYFDAQGQRVELLTDKNLWDYIEVEK